jgi:hypothetical protein
LEPGEGVLGVRLRRLDSDLDSLGEGAALTWEPLSVREGRGEHGPYEGVPSHLTQPLAEWVNMTFGWADNHPNVSSSNGPLLAAAICRYVRASPGGQPLTVRQVTWSLIQDMDDGLLDAVDAVLALGSSDQRDRDVLEQMLRLGGSVWQVDPRTSKRLVRRVDPTGTAAFIEASSPDDVASTELGEAWGTGFGRNPDPSDAWDHSIKAVEAVLIPIVTPNKAKATLGDVLGTLRGQGGLWQLVLRGHDESQSVAPLVSMLQLMWPNPDRHGGQGSRQPSRAEAEAVVHLAVAIVQWARSGVLSKR